MMIFINDPNNYQKEFLLIVDYTVNATLNSRLNKADKIKNISLEYGFEQTDSYAIVQN